MAQKQDPEVTAVQVVYTALKGLDSENRRRVLSSALALLGMEEPASPMQGGRVAAVPSSQPAAAAVTSRPVSLIEAMQEKRPTTNVQRIAVFAYHREKNEAIPRFSRNDLENYFANARLPPSSNYGRDFLEAVRRGWIHEDGADSYLTSKGVEAVEAGFSGEKKYLKPAGGASQKQVQNRNIRRSRRK